MISSGNEKKEKALEILAVLKDVYPNARTLLDYTNPFELLVATILAAQCTDERVNKVTPALFRTFPTPSAMAAAPLEELEELVRSTGFFHNKARSIKNVSAVIVSEYNGKLPESVDLLAELPGVGRKTANVIAGNCFGAQAIIVDTHFKRVTGRLGLVASPNPDKIEMEIAAFLPRDAWSLFSQVINFHGRYRCKAKTPECPACEIVRLCPYNDKTER